MAQVSSAVAQAAGAFGLDAGSLRALGGNSGSAWGAGHQVLSRPARSHRCRGGRVGGGCRGAAGADRARTWTILTLDPAARARRGEPGWAALLDGWAESATLHDVLATYRAWACEFMRRDLARRYSADELKHLTDALDEATEDAQADGSGQRG
jgi:hypothetical protein